MQPSKPFIKHMTLTKFFGFALAGLLLASCEYLQVKDPDPADQPEVLPIARVHNTFLYPSDVEGIVKPNVPKADSTAVMSRFVRAWVKKQLMLEEAAAKIDFDEAELERKILDYRYALMVYQYQKYHVEQTLDENVSETEISEYYSEHQDNFQLKQPIIRGKFVRLSLEAPQVDQFRIQLRSDQAQDREEIKSYCFRFAESYSLDDSTWMNFAEMVKGSPWNALEDKSAFLQDNKFVEVTDEQYRYFLKINDFKGVDELSPLEFVRDQIHQVILNRRKVALTDQLEEDVYDRALNNNDFEIFSYE